DRLMEHRTRGEKLFDVCNYILLSVLMLATLYPFVYVVLASVSEADRFLSHTGLLLRPLGFSTEAYRVVFANPSIWSGYRNTLIVVVGGTALNLLLTTLGAYGLSRRHVL